MRDTINRDFEKAVANQVAAEGIQIHRFAKGERKDYRTQRMLKNFSKPKGILYLGTAQEKMSTIQTEKQINPKTGSKFPWLVRATAVVKCYCWHLVAADFGPLFIQFGSYFPYPVKVCLNGNEYLKRHLAKEGIDFEALDNGPLTCADPVRAQAIANALDERKIQQVVWKWLDRLPKPLTDADRLADYQYQWSILQAEFPLTQVFDRPLTGRQFFDQVIRDNLIIGHPSQVSLIFQRRVTKATPGEFQTRIITDVVIPSLHVDYKHSKIEQHHKEGRALRTETTSNDTRDFAIGRSITNLSALRTIGFSANRRLLGVQCAARDGIAVEDAFRRVHERITTPTGERVAG